MEEQENKEKINTDCGIYLITNLINGKQYIGQSVGIQHRWVQHKNSKENYPISKAIRKYGRDNFKFEIIENCSPEELDEKEIYYIKVYNTIIPNGYNVTYGGGQGLKTDYKAIYEKWKEGYLCKELEEIFDCEDGTVHNALLAYGVTQEEIYKRAVKDKTLPIIAFDKETKEPLKYFHSVYAAKTFFKTNHNSSFIEAVKEPFYRTAYGYYWDFANENNLPKQELNDKEFWNYQKLDTKLTYERTPEFREKISLQHRVVERPNREEFKKMIRTTSFLQLGRQFGVTDNAIRRWCDLYNLPRYKREIKKFSDEEWDKI